MPKQHLVNIRRAEIRNYLQTRMVNGHAQDYDARTGGDLYFILENGEETMIGNGAAKILYQDPLMVVVTYWNSERTAYSDMETYFVLSGTLTKRYDVQSRGRCTYSEGDDISKYVRDISSEIVNEVYRTVSFEQDESLEDDSCDELDDELSDELDEFDELDVYSGQQEDSKIKKFYGWLDKKVNLATKKLVGATERDLKKNKQERASKKQMDGADFFGWLIGIPFKMMAALSEHSTSSKFTKCVARFTVSFIVAAILIAGLIKVLPIEALHNDGNLFTNVVGALAFVLSVINVIKWKVLAKFSLRLFVTGLLYAIICIVSTFLFAYLFDAVGVEAENAKKICLVIAGIELLVHVVFLVFWCILGKTKKQLIVKHHK